MKRFKNAWQFALLVTLGCVALAYAGTRLVRYTVGGSQIFDLRSDGLILAVPVKSGDNSTVTSVTMPTTTTGSNFSQWVPVYNVGAAVTQGDVLIASNTGTGYVMAGIASSGATNVVGVAAESIASAAKGWMVPLGGGYAVVHTTGTVAIGDILVTTTSAAAYLATNNSPSAGTTVAKAMSAGTAAGGSTLAIMQ